MVVVHERENSPLSRRRAILATRIADDADRSGQISHFQLKPIDPGVLIGYLLDDAALTLDKVADPPGVEPGSTD